MSALHHVVPFRQLRADRINRKPTDRYRTGKLPDDSRPIADVYRLTHNPGMTLPTRAASCLVIGAAIGLLLWLLGDSATAIAIFAAEAIGWATLYTVAAHKAD